MAKFVNPYAHGKFNEARSFMARSRKPLRWRVSGAYLGWLLILRSDDLADSMQGDFELLQKLVTEKPSSHWRGAVEETMAVMHWTRVQQCADLIVSLANKADHLVDPRFDYRIAA